MSQKRTHSRIIMCVTAFVICGSIVVLVGIPALCVFALSFIPAVMAGFLAEVARFCSAVFLWVAVFLVYAIGFVAAGDWSPVGWLLVRLLLELLEWL
jgi:hypothetical protein